jgi:hypothetical protein
VPGAWELKRGLRVRSRSTSDRRRRAGIDSARAVALATVSQGNTVYTRET